MVDYYLFLSRAVKGIPPSMRGAREALYERVRKTLTTDHMASGAPVGDAASDRRALEEAIARLEEEFAPSVAAPAPAPPVAPPPTASVAPPPPVITAIPVAALKPAEPAPPPVAPIAPGPAIPEQKSPIVVELPRKADDAAKTKEQALPPAARIAEPPAAERAPAAQSPDLAEAAAKARMGSLTARSPQPQTQAPHPFPQVQAPPIQLQPQTLTQPQPLTKPQQQPQAAAPQPPERPSAPRPELRLLVGKGAEPESAEPAAPISSANKAEFEKILRSLPATTPGVEASALISKDGQMIASAMAPLMDEARVAGVSATLLKLGERAARELGRGEVQELVVRADQSYAVMIGAGHGALLLALANESGKLGSLLFGMQEAAKALEKAM